MSILSTRWSACCHLFRLGGQLAAIHRFDFGVNGVLRQVVWVNECAFCRPCSSAVGLGCAEQRTVAENIHFRLRTSHAGDRELGAGYDARHRNFKIFHLGRSGAYGLRDGLAAVAERYRTSGVELPTGGGHHAETHLCSVVVAELHRKATVVDSVGSPSCTVRRPLSIV